MVMVWFGNMYISFLKSKISYRPYTVYTVCYFKEKIRKKTWWQHHQTKLSMALTSAVIYISSLDSICNLYGITRFQQRVTMYCSLNQLEPLYRRNFSFRAHMSFYNFEPVVYLEIF
jgi:hypothetical protein